MLTGMLVVMVLTTFLTGVYLDGKSLRLEPEQGRSAWEAPERLPRSTADSSRSSEPAAPGSRTGAAPPLCQRPAFPGASALRARGSWAAAPVGSRGSPSR